jgi:hypothetical protein
MLAGHMRPIPHRSEADDEDEDDALTADEAMAGEEAWLDVQEF